jgi:hypothetical protein
MTGLLQVCAACPTPHLKFELHPSWNNIHNMFPTGTTQDTTMLQHKTALHLPFLKSLVLLSAVILITKTIPIILLF